ncbi:ETC complex I subunit conserved region-domain-containing protein [Lipomyces kononenkoae]|uniref:ETC complex I subunit conserved region-domain-containing protein n=1 Tax=Lipomyces kononenkoae TaxID=34357 RepID=A0ACC3SVF9_LIPKO
MVTLDPAMSLARMTARRSITTAARPARLLFVRYNSSTTVPSSTEPKTPAEQEPLKRYDIISGAPEELSTKRIVRIYQQAKTAMQSGTWGTKSWRLDWDVDQKSNRWENDMMGWNSSGDYMQATEVKFKSKEDAIRFATNQGWDYYIQEPHKRDFRPKQYASNFLHSSGPLKHIRTK